MARALLIGTRIREQRILKEIKQTDLAKMVGISPAYLNLIEHNRRRIGGKLMLDIAEELSVEPALLNEGAQAALISALHQASADFSQIEAETPRLEEFAGRFPGLAELIVAQSGEIANLKQAMGVLNDRFSHDPFLSTALHEVISTVSSIQSSAAILVEADDIEKEWCDRFQRNIFEDSRRLADTSQSLVGYLDPDQEGDINPASPIEELDRFLESRDYCVPELEEVASANVSMLLDASEAIKSMSGKTVAERFLTKLQAIITRVSEEQLIEATTATKDPAGIAARCGVSIPEIFQRLAYRKAADAGQFGYLAVDAAGALLAKRPIDGFDLPRLGGGCPLWPLFSAFSQPNTPIIAKLKQVGRDAVAMKAYAIAVAEGDASFSTRPRYVAHMLLAPDQGQADDAEVVGVSCRICELSDCAARREVSIFV